ncbi:class I SAM-dependent methyltransferase [Acidomonas methanolica]|uniref:Ribosomal protein L11 methyltransferase n=1 Tax=Acidomonas methanolica NBRC 104435 TaxID=1231351 RepID=A0A023D3P9_ACIMT|nr:50S ribosomal protein L11 methyltransferase [Acidomonas methanolica]MBU2653617.1 50S ribosomal protein L11 methyltransferase [Acidomonas methanolica]TCS31568.1 putative nicotinamide N-methyase [Acidomonas methanolica]GAJ28783.1 ribosomal protein L11 methyltransferase [Acidomonas methanolica NBRC 104435]GBQ56140.1 50S ribosomal protein L11 methyltransferase [Acidomonas methanolica]GEK97987.1 nicotinamide N-methylase [Acidomonas methanolica NBRC 104435]
MNAAEAFITAQTAPGRAPLVPEITLHLAGEITPIWQATEALLAEHGMEPPFWAFAWPGSQLLARHILDHPELVRGKRVLDFACGSGLAAIAAAYAGASEVLVNDIDPMALTAAILNAGLNGVTLTSLPGDLVGTAPSCDLIVSGDVCYSRSMAESLLPWLRARAAHHPVLLADPGRAYAPRDGLTLVTRAEIPTTLELEDRTSRTTTLYLLHPEVEG